MISLLRHTLLVLLMATPLALSAEEIFTRIYSAEELTEDGEYIIGAKAADNRPFYLLKANFSGLSYGTEIPVTISQSADMAVWTVVYHGGDIILTTQDQYVYASNANSTGVKLHATQGTTWKVRVDDNLFSLINDNRFFSIYSSTTSAKFGNYTVQAKEGPLVIYKRSIPLSQMNRYERYLDANTWETLCLPFNTALPAGLKAYEVSERKGTELSYTSATSILAGHPYIIQSESSQFVVFSSHDTHHATTPSTTSTGIIGTFLSATIHQGYILNGKQFAPAAPGCIVPAFRCYLTY